MRRDFNSIDKVELSTFIYYNVSFGKGIVQCQIRYLHGTTVICHNYQHFWVGAINKSLLIVLHLKAISFPNIVIVLLGIFYLNLQARGWVDLGFVSYLWRNWELNQKHELLGYDQVMVTVFRCSGKWLGRVTNAQFKHIN